VTASVLAFATLSEYLPEEETMTTKHVGMAAIIAALLQFGAGGLASAAPPNKGVTIGTTFPDHFPVIRNFYLGQPVIGFGSDIGGVERVPVIFLHGNNDSPFATSSRTLSRVLRSIFVCHRIRIARRSAF